MPPTLGHGKICYLEIPATDPHRSADFYARVFGWKIHPRPDGTLTFSDGVGEVNGIWIAEAPPAASPAVLIHLMVDNAETTLQAIVEQGGEITQPMGAHALEITARFRDPAGNLFGIYQDRGRA